MGSMNIYIPKMQKAMVLEKRGGKVVYKDIPVQEPGPDEVLVNIKYSGVCHTDPHAVQGDWPVETKIPLVGGHEGAGVVVAKGSLVDDIEIGDYAGVKWINGSCLACEYCMQSHEPLCAKALLSGYTVDGSFQQYCIAKAAHIARIPKELDLADISPVLCAGITVYKGLKESGAKPGETVAIVGAGGGLGAMAQQYAKAMGLQTIAIDTGDDKKAACEKLGSTPSLISPSQRMSLRMCKPRLRMERVLMLCFSLLCKRSHSSRLLTTSASSEPSLPLACQPTLS